jgi:hypothetical protein
VLTTLSEEELKELLDEEITGERRMKLIERLHQRYNILRVARERKQLLGDKHGL